MKPIIECVPNFSEGINANVIDQIVAEVRLVKGVKLLNVDAGHDANRTVITFAGAPEAVVEAAFNCIKKAGELVDMRTQKGQHPRMGATDVCPLIPVSDITLAEVDFYARQLAARVGAELNIPVYLYEYSQPDKRRSNLSVIRSGEYEGFFEKIKQPGWQPDFGPEEMNAKTGATVIGARNFLIAYNVNLNTTSVDLAAEIAADVRESGRLIANEQGKTRIPGLLKGVKAIGWYMEEYKCAQVSTNITDIALTPIQRVFETIAERAKVYGVEATGSELIGLIPLSAIKEAGQYFADKEVKEILSEDELLKFAVKGLGLDALKPFDPKKRILEYLLKNNKAKNEE
jgi:glutamate formiminotransferase/formiminotetrahydrofolate cyclodeaminase